MYFPTVTTYSSIKYGPITPDSATRNETFLLDEIKVEYNSIRINDDPWEISAPRTQSFLNLRWDRDLKDNINAGYDVSEANVEPEDLVRLYLFSMDNVGYAYERKILTVNEVLGNLGGLAGTVIGLVAFVDTFFGGPFRELDRNVSFRKL